MYRIGQTTTLLIVLLAGTVGWAAPRPEDKTIGPSIVGQAQSLDDLLKATKAMVKAIGGDTLAQAFEREALPQLDFKKIPGIDPKRPFGLYGTVDVELSKCRGVLLIPITSEKELLEMLVNFGIMTEKQDGIYKVETPPDVPFPVFLKVHKQYAYLALGGSDALEPKAIYEPNEVINDKEKSLVYFGLRLDRIPKETKKLALANLRDASEQWKESTQTPELKEVVVNLEKLYMRWLRILFDEAKEVALRFDANPKSGELIMDLTVEGMPKSPLAEYITKRPPTRNAFASLGGDDAVQRLYLTAPLFADEMKDVFAKLLDYGKREALGEVQGGAPEVVKLIDATFNSLKATVLSGELDMAASFRGPNKDGFYNAVGAFHLQESAALEKAIKEAVKIIPGKEKAWFKFDTGKIGDLSVHQIDFNSEANEMAKKLFGKGNIAYFAFGKDAVYLAYGPDGMKMLKEAVDAKPKLAASLDSWADGKRSAAVVKKMLEAEKGENTPEPVLGMIEAMSKLENAAGLSIKIDGGDKLRIRINYGAVGIGWMFFGMGFQAGAAAPPAPVKN